MKKFFAWIILAVTLCLAGCTNFTKHSVQDDTPLQTTTFLDKPDKLVKIENGKETDLTDVEDSIYEIHKAFKELMQTEPLKDTLKTQFRTKHVTEWKKEYLCVEFRYDQRRAYQGGYEEIVFDAMLLVCYDGGIIAVPYLERAYKGVNGGYLFLVIPEEYLQTFKDVVQEF